MQKSSEWYKSLSQVQKILYRELYKKDFYEFFREFWDTYETAKLVDGPLLQVYCEVYQYLLRNFIPVEIFSGQLDIPAKSDEIEVIDVRENKQNMCINMPPSHCKSSCLNVASAVWTILNCPMEIASVSHTEGLSTEMNKKRQRIMNSEKFKFFFPEVQLIENSGSKLVDNRHSNLFSVNRNAFTGYHASVIIADDITNARTAVRDKTELQNAVSFYRDTLPSRLADPLTGVILNIQQRLSQSDITSNILNDIGLRNQYTFVILPAQFEKETYIVCPISGTVFHFNVGDYLWTERFGTYESLKAQVGESVWQTQYLQKPVSRTDAIIKEDMLREEDATSVPAWDISNNCPDLLNIDRIYSSNDFPVKKTNTSDFLGCVIAYKVKKTLYVFDCIEERQNFIDSVRHVKSLEAKYPGIIQICENKANGSPLLDSLKDEVSGMQPFEPGLDSKEERLNIASPWISSGNVVFIKTKFDEVTKKWMLSDSLMNLKQKLLDFPAILHDDIVDALSMLILYVFNDMRYSVYSKSFNELNIINKETYAYDYSTTFFVKNGDQWKAVDIGVKYDIDTKLVILKELLFTSSIDEGLKYLKGFTPDKNVFIDCSMSETLSGVYNNEVIIEKYDAGDLELSVGQLNIAFGQNKILIDSHCKLVQSDIESFKYSKKDINKFRTNDDGFVRCIRTAIKYYGGIY